MTTKFTVDAHAGWPVKLSFENAVGDGTESKYVKPGLVYTDYIHSTRSVYLQEIQTNEEDLLPASDSHLWVGTSPEVTFSTAQLEADPILKYFRYAHLPEHLKSVSKFFAELAKQLVVFTPRSAERTVALRKLLESKDAAVRSKVE